MIVFFFAWAYGNFWIFFAFELVVLNMLMIVMMTVVQKKADAAIAVEIERLKPVAV
jgi:heme exporter protein D